VPVLRPCLVALIQEFSAGPPSMHLSDSLTRNDPAAQCEQQLHDGAARVLLPHPAPASRLPVQQPVRGISPSISLFFTLFSFFLLLSPRPLHRLFHPLSTPHLYGTFYSELSLSCSLGAAGGDMIHMLFIHIYDPSFMYVSCMFFTHYMLSVFLSPGCSLAAA
jgi:hypothetical protein